MAKKTTSRAGTPRKTATKRKTAGTATGASKRKGAAKRELVDTGADKRYVRRTPKGKFKESDDVGRSHAADQRRNAKTTARPGQGDKGDR